MRRFHAIPLTAVALFLAACSNDSGPTAVRPTSRAPETPRLAVGGVSGASYTTVNTAVDGTDRCLNGSGLVNCNIYTGKQYVWISGGPTNGVSALSDGTYFFAVLVPGGQNNDVNDGQNAGGSPATGGNHNKNLSDDVDTYVQRTFTVVNHQITTANAAHDRYASGAQGLLIRLADYLDTSNPGGEYDVAICQYSPASYNPVSAPVDPNTCKYDNFKVRTTAVTPTLRVTKTATTAFERTYAWKIAKAADKTTFTLLPGSPTATANYTVTVDLNGSTDANWHVKGNIKIENTGTVIAQIKSVTDETVIGNPTPSCGVTFPYNLAIGGTLNCSYDLTVAAKPTYNSNYTNTATAYVTDPLGGSDLQFAGNATFQFASPTTLTDECINVTDTNVGTLGTVCVGDPLPKAFKYSLTFGPYTLDDCGTTKQFPNTATYTTNDLGLTGSASATVSVDVHCQGCTPGYWKNNLNGWAGTGLSTGTRIDSYSPQYAFGVSSGTAPSDLVDYTFPGTSQTLGTYSLLTGLGFQGGSTVEGKGEILLRAGIAALLNASYNLNGHTFVYPFTATQVRTMVNGALSSLDETTITNTASTLDRANNSGACPLNAKGAWTGQF